VLAVARSNPTDGTRMVAALAGRELGGPVNRTRVQRLMREHRLLQLRRSEGRRRRPGFFRVERPDQLWHLDMTSVWGTEHGWCYLNAAIDCCTREITAWALDVRCRAPEAIAVIEQGRRARHQTGAADAGHR
jgi:putative transposase